MTVEIRAGIPEPIFGPAVGAMEPTTSMVSSFTAPLSARVVSGTWPASRVGPAGSTNSANRQRRFITDFLLGGRPAMPQRSLEWE